MNKTNKKGIRSYFCLSYTWCIYILIYSWGVQGQVKESYISLKNHFHNLLSINLL